MSDESSFNTSVRSSNCRIAKAMTGCGSEATEDASAAGSQTVITAATSPNSTTLAEDDSAACLTLKSSCLTLQATKEEDQMQAVSTDCLNLICPGIHLLGSRCGRCCHNDRVASYHTDRLANRYFVIAFFKEVKHLINHDSCEKMVTLNDLYSDIVSFCVIKFEQFGYAYILCMQIVSVR